MTESDPSRAPDSTGDLDVAPIRPMSIAAALGLTLLATFLTQFFFAALVMVGLASTEDRVVSAVTCQAIAYVATIAVAMFVYAPNVTVARFVGLRSTSWGFYVLGALLGLSLQLPMNALYDVVLTRFPLATPSDLEPIYRASTMSKRVLIGFGLVAFGPLAEEALFRGGLFVPLLRRPAAQRAVMTVGISAVLFAAVHMQWQHVLCVLPMGIALGLLRYKSGSFAPAVFAHATFNAVAMAQISAGREAFVAPASVLVMTTLSSLLVLGGIVLLGQRSEAAEAARAEDAA
ncbi:MAG: CPBP family intramembrane metalloprotease [Polyangiaceae bacterium]|nr:CPBP family intramembrane metalloprotease [Polyangiaceae bacterium]